MAVNLPITVDPSNAEAGLKAIGDEAIKQGDRIEQGFEEAASSAGTLESRIDQARQQIDRLGDAQSRASQNADMAADSTRKATQNTESMKGSLLGFNAALEVGKKVIEVSARALDAMAASGNQGAADLKSSFTDFQSKLLEVANDPSFSNMLTSLGNLLRGDVTPAAASFFRVISQGNQDAADDWAIYIASVVDGIKILGTGRTELVAADQKRRDESQKWQRENSEALKREAESLASIKVATEELAKIEDAKRLKEIEQQAQMFSTEEEARAGIEQMKKEIENVNTSHSDRLDLVLQIRSAEERILELAEQERQKQETLNGLMKAEQEVLNMEREAAETAAQKQARLQKEVSELHQEINRAIEEGVGTAEEANALASRAIAAKRELLQIEQQQKAEEERKLERQKEVAKEIERINGAQAKEEERQKQTKGDLEKIADDAQKKLEEGVESLEEQNRLLRDMEDAKRRIADMDRKAADDRKRIYEEEKRSADEARKRLL